MNQRQRENKIRQEIEIQHSYDPKGDRTYVVIPMSAWSERIEQIIEGNNLKEREI